MNKKLLGGCALAALLASVSLLAACRPETPTVPSTGRPASSSSTIPSHSTDQTTLTTVPTQTQTQPTQSEPTEPTGTEHSHSFSDWVVVQDATCVWQAVSRRFCDCGAFEEAATGEPTGVHTYDEGGQCAQCERKVSVGLFYKLNEDKVSYTVTGIGSCEDSDVVIPEIYKGRPVTAIRDFAFASMGTTPSALRSITIPGTVTHLGKAAFAGCHALTEIHVDPSSEFFACQESILFSKDLTTLLVYPGGKAEEAFRVPEHVQTIGDFAFAHSTGLKQVILPDSVTHIGAGAFNSSALETITFGAGVTELGPQVFSMCGKLLEILVDEGNAHFASVDGVLTHKDGSILYVYPAGRGAESYAVPDGVVNIAPEAFYGILGLKELRLPDSVLRIGASAFFDCADLRQIHLGGVVTLEREAFAWCTGLETLTFGDRLEVIGENAFIGCANVTELTLPESLKTLSRGAFADCDRLETITYAGTVEDWCRLEREEAWHGQFPVYRLYCLDMTEYSLGLEYTLEPDGTYTVTGLGSCGDEIVVIPALHRGLPVAKIASLAFAESRVREVILPDTVTTLDGACFTGCVDLQRVQLGSRVSYIGAYAFGGCAALEAVTAPESSLTYASSDGVLLSKDQTVLILYPEGKTASAFTVPEGIRVIGDRAFFNCDRLETVILAKTVEQIGQEAFSDCDGLVELEIPAGLLSIGREALFHCDRLEKILYSGTVEAWNALEKGALWNGNSPSLQIHCADGVVSREIWFVSGTMNGGSQDIPMARQADGTWRTVEAIALQAGDEFRCHLGDTWETAFPAENYWVEHDGVYDILLDPVSGTVTLIAIEA